MQALRNPVRRYDWGSRTAIPELLRTPPDGRPQAELWLGAHQAAPSTLADGTRLDAAIASDPRPLLGDDVAERFGRLPYLAKVLAADAPLSLQVHPSARQARAGYAAEEAAGVARDAPDRRYRDPHHKPEMIVALTRFEVLCGLRPLADTRDVLRRFDIDDAAWAHLWAVLDHGDEATALAAAVGWLLSDDPRVPHLVDVIVAQARARSDGDPVAATIADLGHTHPRDPGVIVALLLNRVTLRPRDALFLPAGNIHSYLHGTGIEVMASSDNVLRAGLTNKHIDSGELLRVADWTPGRPPWVEPERLPGGELAYRPAVAEFEAVLADVEHRDGWRPLAPHGPRIVLVLRGAVELRTGAAPCRVEQGCSAFVPARDGPLIVAGHGTVVAFGVPRRA